MYKLYTMGCSIFLAIATHAQPVLQVTAGTDLHIRSGTSFYAGGLVLEPSTDYTLNGQELSRHTSVANFTMINYASRVLRFNTAAPAYTGRFQFYYTDDVLNGIPESNLLLNVHNTTYWQAIGTLSRNTTDNYIVTNTVSGLPLSEFALSDEMVTLPLIWGSLRAVRQGVDAEISWITLQEQQVAHFVVERSADGLQWQTISDHIEARNRPDEQRYTFLDKAVPLQRLYYRIRQQDRNGTIRYSTTVTITEAGEAILLQVYPNPAQQSFRLQVGDPAIIQKIELYNNAGALVHRWNSPQSRYDIQTFASGSYRVVIHQRNGEIKTLSLQKN